MMQTDSIQITPELLALITEVDEFKGAWRALGTLAPERLKALRHVATIERYAQKWVESVRLPEGELDRPIETTDKEQYAARRSQLGIQIYQAAADTPEPLDWDQALAAADRQLTGKA